MLKNDFEDFLMEKHSEQYIGTDDAMVDDFSDWLCDLSADDFLRYGDLFAKRQSKELLEACKLALEIAEAGNPFDGESADILRKVITKAENAQKDNNSEEQR